MAAQCKCPPSKFLLYPRIHVKERKMLSKRLLFWRFTASRHPRCDCCFPCQDANLDSFSPWLQSSYTTQRGQMVEMTSVHHSLGTVASYVQVLVLLGLIRRSAHKWNCLGVGNVQKGEKSKRVEGGEFVGFTTAGPTEFISARYKYIQIDVSSICRAQCFSKVTSHVPWISLHLNGFFLIEGFSCFMFTQHWLCCVHFPHLIFTTEKCVE